MATASTVRAALATVEAADAAASLTELPGLLLPALVNLIGADSALWTELDVTPGLGQAAGRYPAGSSVIQSRCSPRKRQRPSNGMLETSR